MRSVRWSRLSDEDLLQLRLCDLKLTLRGSLVARYLAQIQNELKRRGLRFKPHVWLADEWFTPDGVAGIAIPFYMAHPRLMRLERKMMGEVEGGNAAWLMRILRHEAGHAIDNAFRLRRRKDWRKTFGKASRRYPDIYRARPASRDFVLHLGHWYAQSHPTEDFAETFAVWLQPRARWRREYADWPALQKLKYVDELMAEIKGEPQPVSGFHVVAPLEDNRRTLAEHYRRKQARYAVDGAGAYDHRLKRVFGTRDLTHPEISPIKAKSLKGMPATILSTAGFDILRDAGRAYATRLESEGVSVIYLNFASLNHSFLQASGVVADADRAATDTARIFGVAIRSRAARQTTD